MMSLLSFALTLVSHEEETSRDAARFSLVMAGFGTLALLLTTGPARRPEGSYAFDAARNRGPGALLAFVPAVAGAGSKAGPEPFQAWAAARPSRRAFAGLSAGGAVLALAHALLGRDAKRLLARSMIENLGIVIPERCIGSCASSVSGSWASFPAIA